MPEIYGRHDGAGSDEDDRAKRSRSERSQSSQQSHGSKGAEDRMPDHEDGVRKFRLEDPVQQGRRVEELEIGVGHERRAEADERVPLRKMAGSECPRGPFDLWDPVEPDIALEEGALAGDRGPVEDARDNDGEKNGSLIPALPNHDGESLPTSGPCCRRP